MTDAERLVLLKQDLQRTGSLPGDDAYLTHLLQAAESSLQRQGLRPVEAADWDQVVIATAAWTYRKRITGEAEPRFLRRMRMNYLMSQKMSGVPKLGTH